jgi:hypothetical protein
MTDETKTETGAAQDGAKPAEGGGGLLDAVPDGDSGGDRPGWLPEQFWDGEGKRPKLESLAKSWNDLRSRVAKGEGVVPDKPEAYRLPELDGLPKDLVKEDDPLWTEIRAAAHQAGITQAQLEALAKPYLTAAAKARETAGVPADAEAEKRLYAAELARLGPAGAAVVREVKAWLGGLVGRGLLTEAERDALKLVSTAEGVRALLKLRQLSGDRPIPLEGISEDAPSEQDALRMMREALDKRDQSLGERAMRALKAQAGRG